MKAFNAFKAFKYKLLPDNKQVDTLRQWHGCGRWIWNWALDVNKTQYETNKKFIFKMDMSKQLPKLKQEHIWLKDVPAHVLLNRIFDFDDALKKVWRQGAGFPKYKSRNIEHHNTACINQIGKHIKPTKKQIKIPKIGWMKWKMHRPLEGKLKNITIKQENDGWYVICLCDIGNAPGAISCSDDRVVGIDLGLKDLAITSDGVTYDTPKFYRKKTAKLKRAQRTLARRKKGSANREKARKQVNKIHLDIKNQRNDYLHKISTQITNDYVYVAIENLNVKGMTRNRRLSKSIMDQGWTMFTAMLKYKSIWNGGNTIKIDRFAPSTKTCSACGNIQDMPLHIRNYDCQKCNHAPDRDINAAINIKRWGIEAHNNQDKDRAGTARI